MSDTQELIVTFRRGFSEEAARDVVQRAGGQVRRRMRGDREDEVTLLVRADDDALEGSLTRHPEVTRTEPNRGGFGI